MIIAGVPFPMQVRGGKKGMGVGRIHIDDACPVGGKKERSK